MKHKKLVILIIVCVVVFIVSLSAGVAMMVNTIEWNDLQAPGQLMEKLNGLIQDGPFAGLFKGKSVGLTIDESFDLDLNGIKTIRIVGVAETIKIGSTEGLQAECSLKGDYLTFLNPITYTSERNGDTLLIHAKYPNFGIVNVSLVQEVLIPLGFTGNIQVINVSGTTTVTGASGLEWTGLNCKNVSGSIQIDNTNLPEIGFTSISGSVKIENSTAKVNGDTVSGSINLNTGNFIGATLKSVSGAVAVQMPSTASCEFTFKSVSGSFNLNGLMAEFSNQSARQTVGKINDGQYKLLVETVSGSLNISKP